ncbi:MAG: response regulator transcription factor [Gammaproteobacteria bacterium]|jgi:two-component system invasion response regulator UvrY|tara:strand:- start:1795 stop:2439 length:645 start_codon:yes stop_codon:yes gene_type:complete
MSKSKPITVLLVDDHQIVRVGFRRLIETTSDIRVLAEAQSGEESYQLVNDLRPDIIIMDINMPGIGGLEAIGRLRKRNVKEKIIALTVHETEPFPSRVLAAGAQGYLSKRCAPQELIQAIRKVYRGETFVTNQVMREINKTPGNDEAAINKLTPREFQVFSLLAEGRTAVEIGHDMNLSHKTIHSHRSNIMKKLKLETSFSIVQFAILQGIVKN